MGFKQMILMIMNLGRRGSTSTPSIYNEPEMIANGWANYAKEWEPSKFRVVGGHHVENLGDEWTAEDVSMGGTTYGLSAEVIGHFDQYLAAKVLDKYLPKGDVEGMEIGCGGGRLTRLLFPITRVLHAVDASEAMLAHLRKRFVNVRNIRYHLIDGMTLPALPPATLQYVIALDVFIHFEPRLIYWYLRQIASLLKAGGTGIIHYSNVLSPIGWQQFHQDLNRNVRCRTDFFAFGIMCPALMERFLADLGMEIVCNDTEVFPRDAFAVFRKP